MRCQDELRTFMQCLMMPPSPTACLGESSERTRDTPKLIEVGLATVNCLASIHRPRPVKDLIIKCRRVRIILVNRYLAHRGRYVLSWHPGTQISGRNRCLPKRARLDSTHWDSIFWHKEPGRDFLRIRCKREAPRAHLRFKPGAGFAQTGSGGFTFTDGFLMFSEGNVLVRLGHRCVCKSDCHSS